METAMCFFTTCVIEEGVKALWPGGGFYPHSPLLNYLLYSPVLELCAACIDLALNNRATYSQMLTNISSKRMHIKSS